MKNYTYIICVLALAVSCKKRTQIITIPNNTPAVDTSVSTFTIENFVTKTYLVLLARKPLDTELQNHLTVLTSTNIAQPARQQFIQELQNTTEYKLKQWQFAQQMLLPDGILPDTATEYPKTITNLKYDIANGPPKNVPIKTEFLNEFYKFRNLKTELLAGGVTWQEMIKRFCYSDIYYRKYNGGTTFCTTTFQFVLLRIPTAIELKEAKIMYANSVANTNILATVMGIDGTKINDFLNIIVNSDNFYEAQAKIFYKRAFYKEPSTLDLASYTALYKNTKNYPLMQQNILSSNAFLHN